MLRLSRALPIGLLLLTFAASTAGACGWEQTCNTREWLEGELANWLP